MNHIKGFKFGRSQGDRENQIKNQDLKIQALRDKINSIKAAMIETDKQLGTLKEQLESYQ